MLLGIDGDRVRLSATSIILAVSLVAGLSGVGLGFYLGRAHPISSRPADAQSYVERFEMLRPVLVALPYPAAVTDDDISDAAVFVVSVDPDLGHETEVHLVTWYSEPLRDFLCEHRKVVLGGTATDDVALTDVDADGSPEVIVAVGGVSSSRTVVIDFARPRGEEVVLNDDEYPLGGIRTDFLDLDGDGKCEMIKEIWGRKLALREDSWKWQRLKGDEKAYMIYRLRQGKYVLTEVTYEEPKPLMGQ